MADNQNGPEEQVEEDENIAFLPADHPLYARMQARLTKQLADQHERVDLEMIEVEANLKKIDKDKIDVGVRLYSVQQQLAENQMNFEQAHENFNLVQKLRIESEQTLKTVNDNYLAKKKEKEELDKKYLKSLDELQKLVRTLHQIQKYNEQMKGDIKITHTTTFIAEENVRQLESQKKKQDLLIDQMNEEIKRLTEQKTILTAQLISQKDETEQAQQILKEAQLEMQKIVASKKNLLERWQKSIMTMQRMDKALQTIKEALQQQKELNIQVGTELNGISQEIRRESETAEVLNEKNQRLMNERKNLAVVKDNLLDEQKKLEAQISLLKQSAATTEAQVKIAEKEKVKIDEEMNAIETNIMKLHSETRSLWEDLIHSKSEHTTIEKTASNLTKQAQQIGIEIEEKNVELENLQNEIARVKIDQLNTQSQIELLENKKNEVIKEREQKELTVVVYETQIRTGHDLNEKKQHDVGRLNKMHDELMSNVSDQSRGPLEATKNNWIRKTEELKKEYENMSRDWIKKQETLVVQNNQLEDVEEQVSTFSTKQTILEQKKLRLNNDYQQHEKDIREIQNALKNLQNDMNKLNDQLYYNRESTQQLKNENFNIESEFVEKLKQLERESVKLEFDIDRLKEEKAELLSLIVESERQILLWERKIQLEKEMQEALDPTVGQSEIEGLKKDIHVMELRLDDLRKKQEALQTEMERVIDKRETISLKYQNKDKNAGQLNTSKIKQVKKPENSANQIKNNIGNLKNTLNTTQVNIKKVDLEIDNRKRALDELQQDIEQRSDNCVIMEKEVQNESAKLLENKITKYINLYKVSSMQIQTKKFDEILGKTAKLSFPEAQLKQKLSEQRDVNRKIYECLQKIDEDHPNFTNFVSPLIEVLK